MVRDVFLLRGLDKGTIIGSLENLTLNWCLQLSF